MRDASRGTSDALSVRTTIMSPVDTPSCAATASLIATPSRGHGASGGRPEGDSAQNVSSTPITFAPDSRAVPSGTVFSSSGTYTNARLIGRSVWNSNWKLVIPGRTLRADPDVGLDVFLETVTDIQLFLRTYSYSGN